MKHSQFIRHLCVMMVGLVVAGCSWLSSGGPKLSLSSPPPLATPSPEPEPLVACQLLEKAELENIVGETLVDPKQSEVSSQSGVLRQGCIYLASSGEFTPSVQLTLFSVLPEDETSVDQFWQENLEGQENVDNFESVSGLGDSAFFNPPTLFVKHRDHVFAVVVSLKDTTRNRGVTQQVAEQIVTTWPQP